MSQILQKQVGGTPRVGGLDLLRGLMSTRLLADRIGGFLVYVELFTFLDGLKIALTLSV